MNLSVLWLMLPAFFECLVLVGIHSYLGIHVIKRKVIFVDLALAQIAALGGLIAFLFGIPLHSAGSIVFSLGLTAVGAAIFSLSRFRESRIPQEAVIGLVYAVSAATAILLIDKAPHGAEHIKEILTGSILWVKWGTVATAAVVYAGVGAFHFAFRHRFIAISEDPDKAWDEGPSVRLWDFLFYLSFGVVITLSVSTAGVLLVFVFLVAPAIIAMVLTTNWTAKLIIGWSLGLVVTTTGLFTSYFADLPTGPTVIGVYAVVMVLVATLAYVARARDRAKAMAHVGLVATGFAVVASGFFGMGKILGGQHGHHHHEGLPQGEATPEPPSLPKTPVEILDQLDTAEEKAAYVVETLNKEGKSAGLLALHFLESDPPFFFRIEVVETLDEVLGDPSGWISDEEAGSEANRKAAKKIRQACKEGD